MRVGVKVGEDGLKLLLLSFDELLDEPATVKKRMLTALYLFCSTEMAMCAGLEVIISEFLCVENRIRRLALEYRDGR